MNGKDLLEGMSYVDERFIEEAENGAISKGIPWAKVAAMAACLCLLIFGLYRLPGTSSTETAGPIIQDSAIGSPGESGIEEAPAVILYVEEMTARGFIGIVAELVDTDVLVVGMELNVVAADSTRHETADEKPSISTESKTDYTGRYVMVQFIEYNRENATIVVNIIQEVSEKG